MILTVDSSDWWGESRTKMVGKKGFTSLDGEKYGVTITFNKFSLEFILFT